MKNTKNILKAVVVIGITLALVMPGVAAIKNTKTIANKELSIKVHAKSMNELQPSTIGAVLFEDDFESYADFVLDFPPWTQFDGDGQTTWGFTNYDFTNEHYIGSYIIFVPEYTEPPLEGDSAHSGEKYAACFDGEPTDPPNDDWMITPKLSTGGKDVYVAIHCVNHDSFWLGIDDFAVSEVVEGEIINISFWAKTGSDLYEPDRFQVGVSTTDNDTSSFRIITPDPYVEPPTNWTEYTYSYDLSQPELDVSIGGGLGLTATITNNGGGDATDCSATFTLTGGLILLPPGGTKTVDVGTVAKDGGTGTAKCMVFGIGKPTVTVDVTCDEGATASATYTPKFMILFFVLG